MQTQRVLNIIVGIIYFLLLILALYIYISYYLCDNYTCKAYTIAENKTETEKEKVEYIVNNLAGHSTWPIAYIAASILTFASFWLARLDWDIYTIAIVFLVSFLTVYLIISFWGHHYIKPMSMYVNKFIDENCPEENSTNSSEENST